MARTSISLPDDLAERLEPLKGQINISQVCQIALETKVRVHEQIQAALSEEDVMKGLVQRMRIQRAEANDLSYLLGQEDGQHWAIREATYQELHRWGPDRTLYREPRDEWEFQDALIRYDGGPYLVEDTFPSGTAQQLLEKRRLAMENNAQVFEPQAFQMGFLASVRAVWSQVKEELEPELNSPWSPVTSALGDEQPENEEVAMSDRN